MRMLTDLYNGLEFSHIGPLCVYQLLHHKPASFDKMNGQFRASEKQGAMLNRTDAM